MSPSLTARALIALALMFVLAVPAHGAGAEDDMAVRVNGVVITRAMVRELTKGLISDNTQLPTSDEIERLTQAALDSLIELELLCQEAAARRITVADRDVDKEIARSRARFADAAQFAAALQKSGMTESQLRTDTRKTLLANRVLIQVVWKDIRITPAAVRAFYDENPDAFVRPEQVRVRQLVVRPAGQAAVARRRAEDLRAQLAKGADFAALVRANSEEPGTASRGGDLGYVGRGELPPALESAAFSLTAGQVSPVIEASGGYYIVQVVERRAAAKRSFDEVQEGIVEALTEEERQHRQTKFVAALRQKAKIEFPVAPTPAPE